MSIETLQDDLKANMASVRQMNDLTTAGEIVSHLKNTFWPFMESAVDEMVQLDGCVEDLLNHAEDILQPETGSLLMGVVAGGLGLVGELRKRLTTSDDPKILVAIGEFEKNANEAIEILNEITIPVQDDDEEEEDDGEGDEAEGDD